MNATEWEALFAVRQQLLRAGHGQKARVTQEAAKALGCSVATLYRRLEEAGLETGRKRRADAGQSAMSETDVARVGGIRDHPDHPPRSDGHDTFETVHDGLFQRNCRSFRSDGYAQNLYK